MKQTVRARYRAADLFCGAGGTATGAHASGYVSVKLAVNHWRPAVYSHQQNHPDVRHICAEIDQINPRDFEGLGIDVLMASPECVFHSNARGGKPVDDQRRASAWCVPRWAEVLRPKWIVVENVREFADWAPLGVDNRPLKSKKGEIFAAWVQAPRALNYHVEWRLLNAADFGGATKRIRLFVVGRRGRSTQPIPWPEPSHTKEQWTPAASIIDWSRPCPSIFGRKRPLAEKTLKRIEVGIKKFAEPFIVKLRNHEHAGSVREPLNTLTTGGHYGLAMPFVVQYHNGPDGERRQYSMLDPLPTLDTQPRYAVASPFVYQLIGRGAGRASGADEPLATIVAARESHGIVAPFFLPRAGFYDGHTPDKPPLPTIIASDTPGGVVMPFMVPNFGERDGQEPRSHGVDQPLPTVTGHGAGGLVCPYLVDVNHGESNRSPGGRVHDVGDPLKSVTTHHGQAVVLPFLTEYFGTGKARSVNEPLSTVTTKHRRGLTLVKLMQELGIVDIGFRMLDVDELAAAQGFPRGYELFGTKAEQIKQIGNSVHTLVAKAICTAIGEAA